jgi:hypothetical protein
MADQLGGLTSSVVEYVNNLYNYTCLSSTANVFPMRVGYLSESATPKTH